MANHMTRDWCQAMDSTGATMDDAADLALYLGGPNNAMVIAVVLLLGLVGADRRAALSYAFPAEVAAYQLWRQLVAPDDGPPGFTQFHDEFHAADPDGQAVDVGQLDGPPAAAAAAASTSRPSTHPGIELRMTGQGGQLLAGFDSDYAHYRAIFSGCPIGVWRTVLEQYASIDGDPHPDAEGLLMIRIELRPVELDDVTAPDDLSELDGLDRTGPPFPPST